MRASEERRKTAETDIFVKMEIDGRGTSEIDTGVGFMDHMLTLFAKHSGFDLTVKCDGDNDVDDHHSVEDLGILLGKCFRTCLGEKRGIRRYGDIILPMDEALMMAALDISGRGFLGFDCPIPSQKIGDFDTELVKEFFLAFTRSAEITLHFKELSGENSHHIAEAMFKAFGRVMKEASSIDERFADAIPSTKGVI